MIGRVTNQMATRTFVDQMFRQRAALEQARQQVSTGLKIENPGDDPGRAGTIASFQSTVNRLKGHQDRISYATSYLEQQESIVSSGQEIMLRAKEIANQVASSTMGVDERLALSEEVFALRDQLVNLANSTFQGTYLYGGLDDDDAPIDQFPVPPPGTFTPGYSGPGYVEPAAGAASFRYRWDREAGTGQTRSIQISDYEQIRVTSTAELWEQPIASLERLGRALAGFRTEPPLPYDDPGTAPLPDGTGAAYVFPADRQDQTEQLLRSIDEVEFGRARLQAEQQSLGARLNQTTRASQILQVVIDRTDAARASIQEADPYETASNFSNLQINLQALLASGAQINNLSLLNFL